ncbi:MAG TPA: amidohydrolase family protein [Chitinophagaceae bacterium]|nr:amidohydrolase family protein [Chitinophagaceae bacterium]
MAWLKFTGDKLFDGRQFLEGKVLITTETGTIEAIIPLSEAGDDVLYHPGILSPGLINCHCHLELSHMKGLIPKHTGLADFVITVMQQRGFAEELIYRGIENAEAEMLGNGIVAVGDICNTAHTLPQKNQGRMHYHNFIEATGFVPAAAQKRFEQAEAVWRQFSESEPHTLQSIVPHAPYSTSPELMRLINNHSAGNVITIHNQESPEENSFFLTGESGFRKLFSLFNIDISFFLPSGKTSLQTYFKELDKTKRIILVHNTFVNQQDIDFTKRSSLAGKPETFFCLCPNANLYIENRLPPVDMLRNNSCHIVLGTDSLASNDMLCILGEIKTLRNHFPAIPVEEMLQWATLNGAQALGMENLLGSFEKGKKPRVLAFNGNLDELKRLV